MPSAAPRFEGVPEAGMAASSLIPRLPSWSLRGTRSRAESSRSSCSADGNSPHEHYGEVWRVLPFLRQGRFQRARPTSPRGTADARVRNHQSDRGTVPRFLQAECRGHLSGPAGSPEKRIPLHERRGTPQDLPDYPRRQGLPAGSSERNRTTFSCLRVHGWAGARRALPRVPGDREDSPDEHERGDPEAGERTPSGRDRDAKESAADSFEVSTGDSWPTTRSSRKI